MQIEKKPVPVISKSILFYFFNPFTFARYFLANTHFTKKKNNTGL